MGTLTLSRFFVLHLFLVPVLIFFFLAQHIYLFRKAGAAGPLKADPFEPRLPSETFYPKTVVMDIGFARLIMVVLGSVACANEPEAESGPVRHGVSTQTRVVLHSGVSVFEILEAVGRNRRNSFDPGNLRSPAGRPAIFRPKPGAAPMKAADQRGNLRAGVSIAGFFRAKPT
jgi:hypothetical protein